MPVMAIRVKVVNNEGDTVCSFRKTTYFDKQMRPEFTEAWAAESKPMSEKGLSTRAPTQKARLAQSPTRTVEGQKYLELPGLTLKWQKVESVLDQVASVLGLVDASGAVLKDDMTAATLTVEQLHKFA